MVVWCRCHARRCAIFLPLPMQTRKQLFVLHPISVCLWDVWLYEELDANLHQKQEKCKSRGYAKLRKMVLKAKKATQNCAKPVRQGCREIKTNGITACFSIKNSYRGTAVAKWMEKSHIVTLRNDMAFYDGRWLLTVCRLLLFAVFQVFQILQGTARAPMALVICMLDGFSCPIAHIQKAKQ